MPTTLLVPRRHLLPLCAVTACALVATVVPASAQDPEDPPVTSTTSPPVTLPPGSTTTTAPPPGPDDPGGVEELPEEEVPVVPDTVPARADEGAYGAQASRIIRQQLTVAKATSVELQSSYQIAKEQVVRLEQALDRLEAGVTGLAAGERAAVRRVEAARRRFEARTLSAVVHGRSDDLQQLITSGDPNDIAVAQALLGSVLEADDAAVRDYLAAKAEVSDRLVRMAEQLVTSRLELESARTALVEARRAAVSAQFNLAVFAAGSEIVISGFVFPVGDPHTFGDSFGAPRMMGSEYEHAHQGTDIMAPAGTPLLACERGIVTQMGTDVLGGTKLWIKGESGTYYYYAHLSAFADGLTNGTLVEAGAVVGRVGDTGNARGGAPHLHFEIHPDGGPAVNPYPLLKVVDDLNKAAKARQRG